MGVATSVGALMHGRQLDLTGTADAPLVSFTREQWPNLVMHSVSGIEELVELLGSTFIPHLVSFLLKWKPLSPHSRPSRPGAPRAT